MRPSGLNATDCTYPSIPVSIVRSIAGRPEAPTSQRRITLSAPPAARVRPSGLNTTEYTVFVGPPSANGPNDSGLPGSVTSHSRTARSAPPEARVRPSGLNATEKTVSV